MSAMRALGWVYVVLCGLALAAGTLLCAGLMNDPEGAPALRYVGPLFLMLAPIYFAPGLIGGWGLLRGAAWARFVIGLLSILMLLLFPIGTALGGFGLWVLFGPNAPKPAAPAVTAPAAADAYVPLSPLLKERPSAEAKRLFGLGVAATFVGAGFIAVLGAGFRLHHQPPPGFLDEGFYPAIAVLAAIVGAALVRWPFAPDGPFRGGLNPIELHRYRKKNKREYEVWKVERARRIAELAADPRRARYAPLVEAGETWSDQEIAYDQNEDFLATCRHLQPIERAMRRAGLPVKLVAPPQVRAPCRIDEAGLWAAFPQPKTVVFREYYMGGRSAEDDPVAFLICNACQSTIDAVHAEAAPRGTPWFPGEPA